MRREREREIERIFIMDSEEMIKRILNGDPKIDIAIDKWKDVANGNGSELGPHNCALCYEYIRLECKGCQIFNYTGRRYCFFTPYRDWDNHHRGAHFGELDIVQCPTCKEIADREIEFLEKVRSSINSGKL